MKRYLIFGFIFLLINHLAAQIKHIDINPDLIISSPYHFDINNDSVIDFIMDHNQNWGEHYYYITPMNNAAIAGGEGFIDTLSINDKINQQLGWNKETALFRNCFGNDCAGNWINIENKFAGIRLVNEKDTLYGWIRFDTEEIWENITLKDYAYNKKNNQPILAGEGIKPVAENAMISDVSNFKDGRDIEISFESAVAENKILEYRIIITKAKEDSLFTVDSATQVLPENYTSVFPVGKVFKDTLNSITKDKNGNPIQEYVPYKVYILSIMDSSSLNKNVLSKPSNELTLKSPAYPVENIQANTKYKGGTQYNIHIKFDKKVEDEKIAGYKIMFVKKTDTAKVNVPFASELPTSHYYSLSAHLNDSITLLSDSLVDINGKRFSETSSYFIYIITLADGKNTNVTTLSMPSNHINFFTPTLAPKAVFAEDIGSSGNSSDLEISFNKIPEENEISEYRIIAVPLSEADSFNLEKANEISAMNFMALQPSANNVKLTLPNRFTDKNGNLISENKPYRIFVLSIANRIKTDMNALSKPSNIITLANPCFFKAGQAEGNNVIYKDIDPDKIIWAPPKGAEEFYFDLNLDGIKDFYIKSEHSATGGAFIVNMSNSITPLNNSAVCVIDNNSATLDTLINSAMINTHLYWSTEKSYFNRATINQCPPVCVDNSYGGIWDGVNNNYLALKVKTNQNIIYGWLRISCNTRKLVLHDFAYILLDPNVKIKYLRNDWDIIITPNPVRNFLQFKSNNRYIESFEIINAFGLRFFYKEINGSQVNVKIDVSFLQSGIYILKVKTNETYFLKKMIKE